MSSDFKATLREDSERAAEWREVFGSLEVSLRSPLPVVGSAPGIAVAQFYEIDLPSLTDAQRSRLIAHIARKFRIDEQEVSATLDEVGCPILSEDVTITVFNPLKWV